MPKIKNWSREEIELSNVSHKWKHDYAAITVDVRDIATGYAVVRTTMVGAEGYGGTDRIGVVHDKQEDAYDRAIEYLKNHPSAEKPKHPELRD